MCYKSTVPLGEKQKLEKVGTRKIGGTVRRQNFIKLFMQEKARIEKLKTRIIAF